MATEVELAVEAALAAERKEAAEKAEREATLKASIIEELKGEPKYKALFNIGGKEALDKGLPAEKQETYEFVWNLRHGINPGLKPGIDKRTLDETTAAEGLPLVPIDLLNEIWIQRQQVSICRQAGIRVFKTDRRVFAIPSEVTPMTAPAVVPQTNAYAENEIAFGTITSTLDKHGSQITCTEELLEDQTMFQSYFTGAVGRAMGLAENIDLYDILSAKAGVHTVDAGHIILDDDVMSTYFGLFQEYRAEAVWIMGPDSVAELRWMVLANPRAYGDFPTFAGGEHESFMGKRLYENRNWLHTGAGIPLMTIANLQAGVAMVEHTRGLQIFVDPYTLKDTGWVSYYPSARWDMVLVQTNCHQNLDAQA